MSILWAGGIAYLVGSVTVFAVMMVYYSGIIQAYEDHIQTTEEIIRRQTKMLSHYIDSLHEDK